MSRKHILVVDDDDDVRTTILEILRDENYDASGARDGAGMRSALQSSARFDGILLDSTMPGEDSGSLARHARTLGLPVIVTSGNLEAIARAERDHLQTLPKPFNIGQLIAALDRAVAGPVPA